MYTGMMIEELVKMVARAEDRAHDVHASELEPDDRLMASSFLFDMSDSQPMMIGVA